MIIQKVKIQQLDITDKDHHLYLTDLMKKAIDRLKVGYQIPGTISPMDSDDRMTLYISKNLPFEKISHVTTNLCIEDGWLCGDIEIYENEFGSIIQKALSGDNNNCVFVLEPRMHMTNTHIAKRKQPIIINPIEIQCINACIV